MVTKKADIYFEGNPEIRVSIILKGNIDDNFCQIGYAVERHGHGKLKSIYFYEEETKPS